MKVVWQSIEPVKYKNLTKFNRMRISTITKLYSQFIFIKAVLKSIMCQDIDIDIFLNNNKTYRQNGAADESISRNLYL